MSQQITTGVENCTNSSGSEEKKPKAKRVYKKTAIPGVVVDTLVTPETKKRKRTNSLEKPDAPQKAKRSKVVPEEPTLQSLNESVKQCQSILTMFMADAQNDIKELQSEVLKLKHSGISFK